MEGKIKVSTCDTQTIATTAGELKSNIDTLKEDIEDSISALEKDLCKTQADIEELSSRMRMLHEDSIALQDTVNDLFEDNIRATRDIKYLYQSYDSLNMCIKNLDDMYEMIDAKFGWALGMAAVALISALSVLMLYIA